MAISLQLSDIYKINKRQRLKQSQAIFVIDPVRVQSIIFIKIFFVLKKKFFYKVELLKRHKFFYILINFSTYFLMKPHIYQYIHLLQYTLRVF